ITTTPVPQDDPAKVSSESTICAWPSMLRSEAAGTPTPSQRSQVGCSALPTGRRQSPRSGVGCCTAGRACAPATSSDARPRSPERQARRLRRQLELLVILREVGGEFSLPLPDLGEVRRDAQPLQVPAEASRSGHPFPRCRDPDTLGTLWA